MIGFAGFVPELMVEIVHAALASDLLRARKAQQVVAPLAKLIYYFGEPGCEAHQRMKTCCWLMGRFPSAHFRRPIRPLPESEIQRLRRQLVTLGFRCLPREFPSEAAELAGAQSLGSGAWTAAATASRIASD